MRREKKESDLNFEDSINITSVQDQKRSWIFSCYQIILVLFAVYGSMIAFIGGLNLPVQKGVLGITILISVLYYFLIFRYRKYGMYTIPLTLFFFIFTINKQWELLTNGFYYLENTIIEAVYNYLKISLGYFVAQGEKIVCLTVLFIVIIQIISFLFTITIQLGTLKMFSFLILGAALGGPLFVGKVPSFSGFFLCVLSILLLLFRSDQISEQFNPEDQDEAGNLYWQKVSMKSGFYIIGIFLILSIFVWWIGSDQHYKGLYQKQKKQAIKIEKAIREFSLQEFWDGLKTGVQDVFFSDKKLLFNINKDDNSGGLSGGKLGSGDVHFTNETTLKLTLPKDSSTIYLKGYVGTHYTGERWEGLTTTERNLYDRILEGLGENQIPAQEQNQKILSFFLNGMIDSSFHIDIKQREIIIDYITANKDFLYLPYLTKTDTLEMIDFIEDSYYTPLKRNSSYHINYYDIKLRNLLELWQDKTFVLEEFQQLADYSEFEWAYRNYVYEVYAKVPEGLERLKELAKSMEKLGGGHYQKLELKQEYILKQIRQIQNYLEWNTIYSLTPGVKPKEKDFAEYFLFDNQKGYCAHYATSAVLLLRCMNIPARYVEGYIVTKQDIENGISGGEGIVEHNIIIKKDNIINFEESEQMTTVEVKDLNAHAWIEVYFNGFGWIPFEVTAGYSSNIDALLPEINEAIKENVNPTKLPTNTPTPSPTPTLEPTPSSAPESNTTSKDIDDSSNPSLEKSKGTNIIIILKNIFIFLLLIGIIVFGILARSRFLKNRRREKIHQKDTRKAVLAIYEEMDRLFGFMSVQQKGKEGYTEFADRMLSYEWNPNDFTEQFETILSARFSKEEVTSEQLHSLVIYYENLRKNIYRQKGTTLPKIWYLDYILVL